MLEPNTSDRLVCEEEIMQRKDERKDPQIKLITDPKKLAWLKAKIERQRAAVKQRPH